MIHIVFQHADVAALKESFELDSGLKGDVIEIRDEFAVGPLKDIYSAEGVEARKSWWRSVLQRSDNGGKVDTVSIDDKETLGNLVERLRNDPQEFVWIWVAQNKHDVSGYYWVINQLKDFQGRIFILHLHNLPFIGDKGNIFYPTNLYNIPAREFIKAKRLAKIVTAGEFDADADEWALLTNKDEGVRTLEDGKKLIRHDYDYYDLELIKFITTDWQKVSKVFHSFFSKSKNTTGDAYLLWRLKCMITDGKIEAQGEIKGIKDFEVKLNIS